VSCTDYPPAAAPAPPDEKTAGTVAKIAAVMAKIDCVVAKIGPAPAPEIKIQGPAAINQRSYLFGKCFTNQEELDEHIKNQNRIRKDCPCHKIVVKLEEGIKICDTCLRTMHYVAPDIEPEIDEKTALALRAEYDAVVKAAGEAKIKDAEAARQGLPYQDISGDIWEEYMEKQKARKAAAAELAEATASAGDDDDDDY
jgi:hypothetical protein